MEQRQEGPTGAKRAAQQRHRPAGQAARALGWFSIGLGLAELLAPRLVARATGLAGRESLVRLYGVREIATGIGILCARDPAPWVWGRVAGDVIDLATLAAHTDTGNPLRERAGGAMAAVAGVAALDLACARSLSRPALEEVRDYSDRRGLPLPPDEMRGAARADFEAPSDFQTPEALRPYLVH